MAHIAIDARIIASSTGRYVERLVTWLQSIDDDHTYSVLVRKKDEHFWQPEDPRFTVVVADFADYSFAEQLGFWRFLRDLKPDLVHFCMPQQPLLYRGKSVTTFHDLTLLNTYNSDKNWLSFHLKQLVGAFAFDIITRKTNAILVPTRYTEKSLHKRFPASQTKTTLTYEAADIQDITPEAYPVPFKRFLLYVGQQSDYKNIKRLGDAHQKLLEQSPDLGLVLVGKKNAAAQKNERYFEANGYKNIHFTDFIPDSQLYYLYQTTEAYVFPSLMEGFGLPGLEAMLHGAPVVSSNATCLPEVYGDAAHYFPPTDTDAMAQAISDVLTDPALRNKLIKNGKDCAAGYSWRRMAEQTHAVYQEVLKT